MLLPDFKEVDAPIKTINSSLQLVEKLEEMQIHSKEEFPDVIALNVGGIIFTTTKGTLLGDPNSMLAALFSGRYKVPRDPDGRFFIDRDGSHFEYILAYLRGERNLPPAHVALKVLEDAEYFQIEGLIDALQIYPNVFRAKLLNTRNERFQTDRWKRELVRNCQNACLQSLSTTSKILFVGEHDLEILHDEPSCVGNQHSLVVTKHLSCGPKYYHEDFEYLMDRLRNPHCIIEGLGQTDMEAFVSHLKSQLTDEGYNYFLMEESACCRNSCDLNLKYYFLEINWK
ncbi:uncharacterized protein LOC135684344 [Rhopilema esculentum]|uniref:uncharacterized protein LOC135684344 n=1 Tax=Rhopilema esculentum TaxID=499914 RepID=UPI0031D3D5DC